MNSSVIDANTLARAGAEALQSGNARKARELFEQAVALGRTEVGVWLGLALACRNLQDDEAKLAAINNVLALDPRNLRALIMKGDHFTNAGDTRSADSFYRAALRVAQPADLATPEIANELQRARTTRQRFAANYEAFLNDRLIAQGFKRGASSERFSQSLDLMLGKKQVFLQEPSQYYFPELPQIQFYNRSNFGWLDTVEAATGEIRKELKAVLASGNAFSPYIESNPDRWADDTHGMIDNPNWGAFYLWKSGEVIAENAARCPKTIAALNAVPFARIKNRTPSVLFSLLHPHTRIPPHNGAINVRLICHLPLIVPGKCTFRVGNDVREWVEGKAWVFDDTVQHEAYNASDEIRVILIFDIWRPELSEEEQHLVATTLEAADNYGKKQPEWGT